jgi:hypothetical protein
MSPKNEDLGLLIVHSFKPECRFIVDHIFLNIKNFTDGMLVIVCRVIDISPLRLK